VTRAVRLAAFTLAAFILSALSAFVGYSLTPPDAPPVVVLAPVSAPVPEAVLPPVSGAETTVEAGIGAETVPATEPAVLP